MFNREVGGGGAYARFTINMADSLQLMLSLALNLVKFLASLKKTQAKIKKRSSRLLHHALDD